MHVSEADVAGIIDGWDDRDGVGTGLLRSSRARLPDQWRLYTPGKRWLFGVTGHVRWVPGASRLDFDLDVDLNPTRFYAHQNSSDPTAIACLDPLDALRLDPARRDAIKDQTLDGNDNVIIGLDRFPDLTKREVWWRTVIET